MSEQDVKVTDVGCGPMIAVCFISAMLGLIAHVLTQIRDRLPEPPPKAEAPR